MSAQTTIVPGTVRPELLPTLRTWFESQWGQVDSFTGSRAGLELPVPRLALNEEGTLIGGLSFTSFQAEGSSTIDVWINALLVAPPYRRQGIASLLVCDAQLAASRVGLVRLQVRTTVPALYEALGWSVLDRDEHESTLVRALP